LDSWGYSKEKTLVSKNKLHLAVDVLTYLVMVCLAATGLVILYRLPHGSPRDGLTLLGLDRHAWGNVHWYLAVALMVSVAVHVVLHWKWVTNTVGALVRSRAARRAGAGLGGGLALFGLGLATAGVVAAPWLVGVERGNPRGEGGGRGAEQAGSGRDRSGTAGHGGHSIRGQTTLAEAAQEAGVPVPRLIAELKLPADADPTERLGHLRQEHGIEMHDVRDAVERLKGPGRPAPATKAAEGGHGRGRSGGRQESASGVARESHEGHDHEDCEETLRGRSTLAEAAQEAGVPVARLLAELKLPADTDPRARLGHLRQEHAFEMEHVRAVVERLKAPATPAPTNGN